MSLKEQLLQRLDDDPDISKADLRSMLYAAIFISDKGLTGEDVTRAEELIAKHGWKA